jgi:ribosome assembly protein YihI (activator of Der GTPase)
MPTAAEKGGSGVSPDYDIPTRTHSEKSQAERIGQAKRSGRGGGSGVSPGYDTTQHAHAQKKTKRIGEAEQSGEGGFEGLS